MAVIKKDGNFMGLPMNIARGNPIPLDTTAVWYSYDELVEYAQSGATAYVGQILAHVDETNNTASAYIIVDTAGNLEPVGAGVITDNKSIEISADEAIQMHDFGKKFYKYIPAVTDETSGDILIPAHYEAVEVSEENPWSEGLEPRVVLEGSDYVLGWYEPNPTTIEGVNAQVATLQTTVNNHTTQIQNINDAIEALDGAVGYPAEGETAASGLYAELDKKANAADVYTKGEADSAIATAIAEVDHLSRLIVNSVEEIDVTAEDADKYIYMVLRSSGQEDNDIYDEYMVINGAVEKVGNWAVDLSQYATNQALIDGLAKKVDAVEGHSLISNSDITKLAGIEAGAEKNYIRTVSSELVVNEEGQLSVGNIQIAKVINLQDTLNSKVDAVDGSRLMTNEEGSKLAGIEAGAQVNIIDNVSADFIIGENKTLQLAQLEIADINGLTGALGSKLEIVTTNDLDQSMLDSINQISTNEAAIEDINELLKGYTAEDGTEVVGLESIVGTLQSNVSDLTSDLGALETVVGNNGSAIQDLQAVVDNLDTNYVKVDVFNSVMGNYQELIDAETDVVSELKELAERLLWQELV